ncbi:hypothetical protein PUR71_18910 [Streptomyces sp. SP17BM10]|nr:hypothetical protein [Streptomyces sp. SP17BM10]MEE1784963.1 hypothetical protein [Streptomyces sp. SP17BM10]
MSDTRANRTAYARTIPVPTGSHAAGPRSPSEAFRERYRPPPAAADGR